MGKGLYGVLALVFGFVGLGFALLPPFIMDIKEDQETLEDKVGDALDRLSDELEGEPRTDPMKVFGLISMANAFLGLVLGVMGLVQKEDLRLCLAAIVVNAITVVLFLA